MPVAGSVISTVYSGVTCEEPISSVETYKPERPKIPTPTKVILFSS